MFKTLGWEKFRWSEAWVYGKREGVQRRHEPRKMISDLQNDLQARQNHLRGPCYAFENISSWKNI